MKTKEIEWLFRQHYNQMIQLARMMLYDDEESRDVVSEVFAMLVKMDITPRNVENYLMTCVRNRCRNLLEHMDVRAKFEQVYAAEMKQGRVEEEDDFSPMAVERRYEQVIAYAKKQLMGQTLQVFQMRHLQGMKYQDIADELGISKVMVYKHLTKAMTIIKEYQQKII
jgi:RNA polymerase sigma-70 factor (ECF subfamily)